LSEERFRGIWTITDLVDGVVLELQGVQEIVHRAEIGRHAHAVLVVELGEHTNTQTHTHARALPGTMGQAYRIVDL
jgi:hypothetical protein